MVVNSIGSQASPEAVLNPVTSNATTVNNVGKSTQSGTTSPVIQGATETNGQEIQEVGLAGETQSGGNDTQHPSQNLNAFA